MLTLDAATHRYMKDDHVVPRSVTGVLKDAGLIDFSHIPPGILDRARVRGTIVHQALHYYNEGDLDRERFAREFPDESNYFNGWPLFMEQRHFVPVLNEHRVYSARYDVAGTIDCLGILDGHAALVDFATGDPADAAKQLQTAGYLALALEWQAHDPPLAAFLAEHPVIRRYAVRLLANGTFRVEHYPDPRDVRDFLMLAAAQQIAAAHRRRPAPLAEVA